MRRSSMAAKSRRLRIRHTTDLLILCFTGTLVIPQCRTNPCLTGSSLFPKPISQALFKFGAWHRDTAVTGDQRVSQSSVTISLRT
jgi:hypothetical protein